MEQTRSRQHVQHQIEMERAVVPDATQFEFCDAHSGLGGQVFTETWGDAARQGRYTLPQADLLKPFRQWSEAEIRADGCSGTNHRRSALKRSWFSLRLSPFKSLQFQNPPVVYCGCGMDGQEVSLYDPNIK